MSGVPEEIDTQAGGASCWFRGMPIMLAMLGAGAWIGFMVSFR